MFPMENQNSIGACVSIDISHHHRGDTIDNQHDAFKSTHHAIEH